MKKIFNGAHTTPEGSGWGPFWCPQHFTNDSSRRPSNTIRIGIGTLWCAKGIYFRILKSHAKTFAPAKFWKRFPTTPIQYLRDRDGRPLICDRASFRKSRIASIFSRPRKFENDFPLRPSNTLGIGMGTLWCAIGIYFGILKSHANFFAPAKFSLTLNPNFQTLNPTPQARWHRRFIL